MPFCQKHQHAFIRVCSECHVEGGYKVNTPHNRTGILSDAQRLEFCFKHNPAFGQDNESTWMAFYVDGKKAVTEGKTHRECIDNVTSGKYWFAA